MRWWVWLRLVMLLPAGAHECQRQLHSNVPASGVVESPDYPAPYAAGTNCVFNLSTIPSNVIHLTFLSLDLSPENPSSHQCLDAFVLIIVRDRQGQEHIGRRLCGSRIPRKLETMQSQIRIEFVVSVNAQGHRGFRIQYDMLSEAAIREPRSYISGEPFATCGGRSTPGQLSGEIVSPGYPLTFPLNCSCNWLIRVEPKQRIYIRIVHLYLSSTLAECDKASLSIVDGYKHENELEKKDLFGDGSEARFCGNEEYYGEEGMMSFLSSANRLLVRFTTSDSLHMSEEITRVGFKIIWTAVNHLVGEEEESECQQFMCKHGHVCIDQGQGICAARSQLCIDSSLVCNGVPNCVEGDYTDEQHCYSREIVMASALAILTVFVIGSVCVCCDQWRKRQRLRTLMRAGRAHNGKAAPGACLPPRPPR